MQPETRRFLDDGLATAREIQLIGAEAYLESRRDALAIERLLEILGEVFVRIRDHEPSLLDKITDAYLIIGMRNVLAHGYDVIDPNRVVAAIRERLPVLIQEIENVRQ